MHIDVSNILDQDTGHCATFRVEDERPDLDDVSLAEALNGEVILLRTDFGLVAKGEVAAAINLECHLCLADFSKLVKTRFTGEYSLAPSDEQWLIEPSGQIDLAPLVRQEIWLELPLKQVCTPNCLGLCFVCGERQKTLHQHAEVAQPSRVRWRSDNKKG
jgi:uncharacterized protein